MLGHALFLAGCTLSLARMNPLKAPPAVDSVDILRYLGRWDQPYADLASDTFESKYCVVADYGVFANGTISVRNRDRLVSVSGAQNGILGWGGFNRTGLGTITGSLTVNLQIPKSRGPPFPAPYDIILLGPPTYGPLGLYEYSVVSDPLGLTLFVLARDYTTFFKKYNKTVIETLEKDGFVTVRSCCCLLTLRC